MWFVHPHFLSLRFFRINGRYGGVGHNPIHYLFKSVNSQGTTANCKNVVRFEKTRLPLISSLLFPHTKQKQLFNCLKCFLLNDIFFEKSVLFEVRFYKESKFEADNIFAICCNTLKYVGEENFDPFVFWKRKLTVFSMQNWLLSTVLLMLV
jgi:hypothetical protein